jgi:EAL domain-containing protein (putative c-di-GMP-specific phosphodiesterase class I)
VVAEGVETAEQADRLRAIGCPKLQGFLIARPMPVEQFSACLPTPLA